MIRRPPRSTPLYSSAASDVYKRQGMVYLQVKLCDPCLSALRLFVIQKRYTNSLSFPCLQCGTPHEECMRIGGQTTGVCNSWPVQRQTYGYIPSRSASPPLHRYQITLLGNRCTMCVNSLPKVVIWKRNGRQSRDLSVNSRLRQLLTDSIATRVARRTLPAPVRSHSILP